MIITLPWPDARLNPNRSKGRHWGSTSSLRGDARQSAFFLTRKMAGGWTDPGGEEIPLTVTFVQPDRRARDRDNLLAALKPSLDGIADGLGVNDSRFNPVTIRREYGSKPGSVLVEVA